MTPAPFSRLPETVQVAGEEIPIRTDFRVWVQFELGLLARRDNLELLHLIYPGPFPLDVDGLAEAAIWFYRCGDRDEEKHEEEGTPQRPARFYDFAQDADVILSSFWQVYGLDLSTATLHWWNFSRLLWGLPEGCPFMRVVHYRTADLTGMDKKQKKHYEKMRKLYALKGPEGKKRETLEERNARMQNYVARRFQEMEKQKG